MRQFTGKHNARSANTIDQMGGVIAGMVGKRLMYRDLIADNICYIDRSYRVLATIADNGLDSGARTE